MLARMNPDWPKIIEVAREAQSHIDRKVQIKSVGFRLQSHLGHKEATRYGDDGVRQTEDVNRRNAHGLNRAVA